MPNAPVIQCQALVLQILPSGERFHLAKLLSPEHGLLSCLFRRSKKSPTLQIDLFDEGEAAIELKPDGHNGFLKEFELSQRPSSLARNYSSLQAACQLSKLLLANPIHPENALETYRILRRSLEALQSGVHQTAVLLKAYYLYCRDEGYPVQQEWAKELKPPLGPWAVEILNTPLARLELDASKQKEVLDSLLHYIEFKTYIRIG